MNSDKKPFHQVVAEKLIEHLKQGTAPWQLPWDPGQPGANMPYNPTTGKRYQGINALQLMSEGHDDQRWMTYKQASALEAQVRKGEKGTQIQYWKFTEEQGRTDADGRPVFGTNGEPLTDTVTLERPKVFLATVFNAAQIDGLPPPEPRKQQTWTAIERAEEILQASGAEIINNAHDRAFYRPATDSIHLPEKSRFPSADNYYATALHELGHWTGHPSRMDRDLAHPFGSEGYAREELRAEIASMILGDELGIGHDPDQHTAYVGSWIKALQEDPLEIFRAAADAEKIRSYVLGLTQSHEQSATTERSSDIFIPIDERASTQTDTEINMNTMTQPDGTISIDERAETWTLDRLAAGTLNKAIANAKPAQVERILDVLVEMTPIIKQNPFWQRHDAPQDPAALWKKVIDATEKIEQRQGEILVVSSLEALRDNAISEDDHDKVLAIFERATDDALGISLPEDWCGVVRVQGNVDEEVAGKLVATPAITTGMAPQYWSVYAERSDHTSEWLADFNSQHLADALADRLVMIDAKATLNEHEKVAKLARINEDRVRRDPASTDEDISAAKDLRKNAEFAATANDEDLQRRIAQRERERPSTPTNVNGNADAARQFIDVPFKDKNEAKALGAKWDRQEQSWYIPSGVPAAAFSRWSEPGARTTDGRSEVTPGLQISNQASERQYLVVPYSQRTAAKAAGAKWDAAAKSWFADPKADISRLEQWKPDNVPLQQGPAMSPVDEFSEALKSIGCVISGEHPIMDGTKHRISVVGEKFSKNAGSGFYVGHLDGHPAGYMKNNKTGAEITWKSKGYTLSDEEKASIAAEAESKLQAREAELVIRQEQAAQRVARQMNELVPAVVPTAYMLAKGIVPQEGALTDKDGKKTYLPVIDVDGKQWSMQYIQENGVKRFAKDSRKEGCFHVVGGMAELAAAPALVISEGYATAATLKQSLGFPTVSAFDSGNLVQVAQALHQKFPEKPVVIAGDDDRHLEIAQGINPGRAKAAQTAALVDGKVLLPVFAPDENCYPESIGPVTPEMYREHKKTGTTINDEQLAALARMKQFTDFNDLANKSALGEEGVNRQVRSVLAELIDKHKSQNQSKHQQLPGNQGHRSHAHRTINFA
jgi:putative DNA primase/helicase